MDDFTRLTNRYQIKSKRKDKDLILKGTTAVEYLELFNGYVVEEPLFAYTADINQEFKDRVILTPVKDYDNIEYIEIGGIKCSALSQAITDLITDDEYGDDQALVEALSNYYYNNNESFDGARVLSAEQKYIDRFEEVKKRAKEFYSCK